ncbi:Uncharacterised protein [Bordetella pertussis]|nr:Uncharacterised protein [Bordetella pertussis]
MPAARAASRTVWPASAWNWCLLGSIVTWKLIAIRIGSDRGALAGRARNGRQAGNLRISLTRLASSTSTTCGLCAADCSSDIGP